MAAIFCQALSKPCEWIAKCCDASCSALTKGCGHLCTCCESLCSSLGECCSKCCGALSECTSKCCAHMGDAFSAPFSGVVFLSILFSLVPLGALVYFLGQGWGASGCQKPLDTWLLIALILFGCNFLFAVYLWRRLSSEDWSSPANNPKFDANARDEVNQHEHAKHFLLYDCGVCLYIVLGLFQFAWAIVGLNWAGASSSCVEQSLRKATTAASVILIVFLVLWIIGCLCSLYSGFITVCANDCNFWKCIFCCCYYPCCYNHAKTRERYYGNQNRLVPRAGAAGGAGGQRFEQAGGGAAIVYGAPVQQQQRPAPQQQQMGGNVYYNPSAARQQQQQHAPQPSPVYAAAPVNYAQQSHPQQQQQFRPVQQASPANYAQPTHPQQQQQPLMSPQSQMHQQQQQYHAQASPQVHYQPPAQQFSPVFIHAQPAQSHPQQSPMSQQHQQAQQYQQPSPHIVAMPMESQQEGVPHSQVPGGAPLHHEAQQQQPVQQQQQQAPQLHSPVPVAQPVARPAAAAQPAHRAEEKSSVAKAADGAKAAAASLKQWWKKD